MISRQRLTSSELQRLTSSELQRLTSSELQRLTSSELYITRTLLPSQKKLVLYDNNTGNDRHYLYIQFIIYINYFDKLCKVLVRVCSIYIWQYTKY